MFHWWESANCGINRTPKTVAYNVADVVEDVVADYEQIQIPKIMVIAWRQQVSVANTQAIPGFKGIKSVDAMWQV